MGDFLDFGDQKKKLSFKKEGVGLPSGKYISFSELNTFDNWCKLQHYHRYFLRLQTKDYQQLRYLIIGSLVHDSVEMMYNEILQGNDPHAASCKSYIEAAAQQYEEEYAQGNYSFYFDRDTFEHDKFVAKQVLHVFLNEVLLQEAFSIEEVEAPFKQKMQGADDLHLLGYMDQVYFSDGSFGKEIRDYDTKAAVEPGLYLGELKTRGASYSRRMSTIVKDDLQTSLYQLAREESEQESFKGVVYTVIKKPPNKLIFADDYKAARREIKEYYKGDLSKHVRRDIIEREVTDEFKKGVYARVERIIQAMKDFYIDPYQKAEEFERPHPKAFPCRMCAYKPICHDNEPIDESFSYKTKRKQ